MSNYYRFSYPIVDLINFANIRSEWYKNTGETRYLQDAKEALKSALVYINTVEGEIKTEEAKPIYD